MNVIAKPQRPIDGLMQSIVRLIASTPFGCLSRNDVTGLIASCLPARQGLPQPVDWALGLRNDNKGVALRRTQAGLRMTAIFFLFVFSALNDVDAAETERGVKAVPPSARVGERLTFSIRWLGIRFGTAEVFVEGIEQVNGRDAYHVVVRARSNKVIDLVYKVRDEHHTYIDVERFHSLRYEKSLQEGRYRADEVMEYDQVAHKATYFSKRSGTKKQMLIPENVHDQLSCAFWLRAQAMTPGDDIEISVNADEKNWKLEVRVLRADRIKIRGLGTFDALEIEPHAQFQGVFVRRGKFRGWMSMDEKRLPLLMKTKIPVLGNINIVLTNVEGW